VSVTAIALLWRDRSSLLTMGLLVAQLAWLIETLLLSLSQSRYSVFWYGGIFGQIASCLVLAVLLYETSILYGRLALAAEQRNKEGERQRLALQVVAASLAHEVQQPLATLLLNGDVARTHLAQTPPNIPGVRAALDDIESDGFRASKIINSIRATVTGSAPPVAPLSIGQLVHQALALVRFDLRALDVSAQLEAAPDLPPVMGNKGQLVQVLGSLITNALEAMQEVTDRPRVLKIRSSLCAPKMVSVTVADSGPGIPAEHAGRIFDPFFTTKSRGTGLGLAICQQIIEAHGGHISASAGTEHGAVFEILLPTGLFRGNAGAAPQRVASSGEVRVLPDCIDHFATGVPVWLRNRSRLTVASDAASLRAQKVPAAEARDELCRGLQRQQQFEAILRRYGRMWADLAAWANGIRCWSPSRYSEREQERCASPTRKEAGIKWNACKGWIRCTTFTGTQWSKARCPLATMWASFG